jgi:hypothetical protein
MAIKRSKFIRGDLAAFARLVGLLILAASALFIVAAVNGFDHYRARPQYNTINHSCLDVACIMRGIR